jgi:hypothetical protein
MNTSEPTGRRGCIVTRSTAVVATSDIVPSAWCDGRSGQVCRAREPRWLTDAGSGCTCEGVTSIGMGQASVGGARTKMLSRRVERVWHSALCLFRVPRRSRGGMRHSRSRSLSDIEFHSRGPLWLPTCVYPLSPCMHDLVSHLASSRPLRQWQLSKHRSHHVSTPSSIAVMSRRVR